MKTVTTSKRSPIKLESDQDNEFFNSVCQNFLKVNTIHHYSRFTDKGPSIAERVIRTIRNLLKRPVFPRGNGNWVNELPSIAQQYHSFTTQLK